MLNQDVYELLEHVKNEISEIFESSKNGTIKKVALKNTLENLRSVLDYSAQNICEKLQLSHGIKVKTKVYFPYGQRQNHFLRSVAKNFPDLLQCNPALYALVESIQPYVSDDSWLVDLCELTNDAKHNKLSETENKKSRTIYQGGVPFGVLGSGSRNVSVRGNIVNGVLQDEVHVNSDGVTVIRPVSGQTYIVENNIILFHGKKIEVVPFINKCHKNLSQFIEKLEVELIA